jgi:hypothetical protein
MAAAYRTTRQQRGASFLNGVGPRVGESAFGRIAGFSYTAPYEDITLKAS